MFNKFFNPENPITRTLSHLFDLAVLNVLCLVFSLPVFTAGCAAAAAAAVCFHMIRDDYTSVWRTFWRAFKQNFRQATLIWLLTLALMALFGVDLWYFQAVQTFLSGTARTVICCVFIFLLLSALLLYTYAIFMTALFENTVRTTLGNAVQLSLRNPGRDLAVLAVDAVMVWIALYVPSMAPAAIIPLALLGFSLTIFLNCRILLPVFRPYLEEGGPDAGHEED